jgi:hypothetical protein
MAGSPTADSTRMEKERTDWAICRGSVPQTRRGDSSGYVIGASSPEVIAPQLAWTDRTAERIASTDSTSGYRRVTKVALPRGTRMP